MAESKKIAGRYQILDEVGRGSESIVYKAKDELLGRIVAVKTFRSSDNATYAATLINEARVMARVQHPNIMPIHDLIQENDTNYLVMPLISRNAVNWFSGAKEKPLSELFRFLDRLADALDFLHSHQIIYRNLKPGSILVSEDNQPYLIGFTISEIRETTPQRTNVDDERRIRSLYYVAPEIIRGMEVTSASDIFSFGLIVYELITGYYPYDAKSFSDMLVLIGNGDVPSIYEYRPELSLATMRDIDAVIDKLTAENPDERYQTAREAVNDLNRVISSGHGLIEGKLFISYACKDEDFVHALVQELQNYNVAFWVDKNIEYGSAWDETIDNQLADCDAILVIVTPDSMKSPYVTYEWSYFIGANKPVLPFVPNFALDSLDMHPRLSRVQFIKGTENMNQNVLQIIEVMTQAMAKRKKQAD
jgi:serine/threonine protein kinase